MTRLADLDQPADGAGLLGDLRSALLRYVVLPSAEAADAVTLWIAATHGQDAWEHAPRAAVISPEKRCGKSRLIDIAEATSSRSIVTVNISPAALVREITDEDPPTLFVDEADTIFGPKAADNHEDLRGIVNSGHQRGRPYIRYDITTRKNEHLATFAMAMLAGIGDLPDTIMDRAVVIRMRRRAPNERVDPYRTRRDRPALHLLRDQLRDWVRANLADLQEAEPPMPVEDRAADTWEPLVAIADLAGGVWPARARAAALALVAAESASDAEAGIGQRLLSDIRDIYTTMPGVGFLPSAELVTRLLRLDDAPWRDLGREGLTQRTLSARLRPYGVAPRHNGPKTVRGYRLSDFGDAIARYVPSASVQTSVNAPDQHEQPDTCGPSGHLIRPCESDPDGSSVRAAAIRPDVSAGQATYTDARTLADGPLSTDVPTSACVTCSRPKHHLIAGVCRSCSGAARRRTA